MEVALGPAEIDLFVDNLRMISDQLDRDTCLTLLKRFEFDIVKASDEVRNAEENYQDFLIYDDDDDEDDDYDNDSVSQYSSAECHDEREDRLIDDTSVIKNPEESNSKPRDIPIMPEHECSESEALEWFSTVFAHRHQVEGPLYLAPSLNAAVHGACHCPLQERRPLLIYLHHDESIQCHTFCNDCLANTMALELLAQSFNFWAWDVAQESRRSELPHLNETLHDILLEIASYDREQFPVLLLVSNADCLQTRRLFGRDLDRQKLYSTLMDFEEDHKRRTKYELDAMKLIQRMEEISLNHSATDQQVSAVPQESEHQTTTLPSSPKSDASGAGASS